MKSWLPPKYRALFFVVIINLIAIGAATLTLDRAGWFWFAPIALSINLCLATYDLVFSFEALRGERARGQDAWGVLKLVHETSAALEIKPPRVYIIDRASAQALTYSRLGRRSRVVFTTGALNVLTPDERAAIVMHQLLTIADGLAVANYWAVACADLCHRVGRVVERTVGFILGWTPSLANALIRPVTGVLNLALISPADFARVDRATAARLSDPEHLARALWKLEAYAQTKPWPEPWTFANICLVSPIPAGRIGAGLRVQPPTSNRIAWLAGRFPL